MDYILTEEEYRELKEAPEKAKAEAKEIINDLKWARRVKGLSEENARLRIAFHDATRRQPLRYNT